MPREKESSSSSSSSKKKEKEPSSSSKEKSSSSSGVRSSSRSSKSAIATIPEHIAAAQAAPAPAAAPSAAALPSPSMAADTAGATAGSLDFEAGAVFERYAHKHGGAGIDAQDFQKMWRDTITKTVPVVHPQQQQQQPLQTGLSPTAVRNIDSDVKFEIGKLFERYNSSKDGRLTRADFEKMVQEEYTGGDNSHSATTAAATAQRPSPLFSSHLYVQRDNTQQHQQQQHQTQQQQQHKAAAAGGSSQQQQQQQQQQADGKLAADAYSYCGVQIGPALTHYNETTGVPLPQEAVTGQVSLGHTVVPLHDAYNRRLSRLQALVSSRLMPAREQLLQLRRRLHTCADEVKAAKVRLTDTHRLAVVL
jgi:hypothetical protein